MNKISSKHFVLFIIGVAFISIKTYPSLFIALWGRDTWICSLIASIIFMAYAIYLIYICVKTNTFNINKIFKEALSPFIGNIFLFIFILTLFLTALECASVEANALHSTIFLDTPVWYALIFFLLPSAFILNKSLRTTLIFILISVSTLIINAILFTALTQSYKNMNYVLPFMGNGLNKEFFNTILFILGSLSSFAISLPYLKFLTIKDHIKKHSLYGVLIVSAIVVISTLGMITAFGPLRASNIFYPELVLGQRIELAGFIEFGEIFFIIQTVIGLFVKYILASYGIIIICEKFMKKRKIFVLFYTIIVFVLSNFIGRNNLTLFNLLKYYQIILLIVFGAIPLIVFTIYLVRYKGNVKKMSQ
ncbi:GerAB/ArcD/ProY family transporter [Clostridium sp.]|uniref:GerAB/ArcD/ProY family transporter n=1 Tax=Clostridium sp. TaxID=1506 RepID=UPI003F413025